MMLTTLLFIVMVFSSGSSKRPLPADVTDDQCSWTKHPNAPEVYFINMDSSVDRRVSMENHLNAMGMVNHRIRGNPWQEIYTPKDLATFWTTAWCKSQVSRYQH